MIAAGIAVAAALLIGTIDWLGYWPDALTAEVLRRLKNVENSWEIQRAAMLSIS